MYKLSYYVEGSEDPEVLELGEFKTLRRAKAWACFVFTKIFHSSISLLPRCSVWAFLEDSDNSCFRSSLCRTDNGFVWFDQLVSPPK